ncbi:3-keto-disaccharide hydrolase [Alishewanella tabrizica]|uniref:Large, multifunctional secreted protein n=1 Tax=Alishewanella tabrizica TaxID=671278 RepID=A0ABQ2WIS3_9ALTE|nr:DUF1080 domain-containing protein [Alishewanella tabrizica]GGW55411.1 large, multifunctional secreted protein [Alishewanella tabrizica]
MKLITFLGNTSSALALLTLASLAGIAQAQTAAELAAMTDAERIKLSEKTEVWEPVPAIITAAPQAAPSDALVLLDANLSQWQSLKGGKAPWSMQDGVLTVTPGSGDITTSASFCDIQLHMEWRVPAEFGEKKGQLRNNSGIFLQQRYEIQILDSYNNPTYPNGQAASVYKQTIPLVNASRAPGEWQTYDIIYRAPRFSGEQLSSPGYITVLHNGVLVQNHIEIQGTTEWIGAPKYQAHGCAPLQLQDHGDAVSFRNIWVRRL